MFKNKLQKRHHKMDQPGFKKRHLQLFFKSPGDILRGLILNRLSFWRGSWSILSFLVDFFSTSGNGPKLTPGSTQNATKKSQKVNQKVWKSQPKSLKTSTKSWIFFEPWLVHLMVSFLQLIFEHSSLWSTWCTGSSWWTSSMSSTCCTGTTWLTWSHTAETTEATETTVAAETTKGGCQTTRGLSPHLTIPSRPPWIPSSLLNIPQLSLSMIDMQSKSNYCGPTKIIPPCAIPPYPKSRW